MLIEPVGYFDMLYLLENVNSSHNAADCRRGIFFRKILHYIGKN